MTPDEFAEKLSKIRPSMDYLISCGYSTKIAEEICDGYTLIKRANTDLIQHDDPLINLLSSYDTSQFQLGMLTLGIRESGSGAPYNKIYVGTIETDILVIDPNTNAVELIDHARPDYVITRCALSGGHFLEAILLIASFKRPYPNLKNLTRSQYIENNQAAGNCAIQCAKIARVPESCNVFKELLGYDPQLA